MQAGESMYAICRRVYVKEVYEQCVLQLLYARRCRCMCMCMSAKYMSNYYDMLDIEPLR